MLGGESVVASLDDELPDVSKAPINDPAQLMSDVRDEVELAAGDVLEQLAPEAQEGQDDAYSANATDGTQDGDQRDTRVGKPKTLNR